MFYLWIAVVAIPVATVAVTQVFRYRRLRCLSNHHKAQAPPCERPWDYIGIIKMYDSTRHLLNRTALSKLIDLFEKYGDTSASRVLSQRVYFTCHPENIKHILVTGFNDYDSSTVRLHLFKRITEHGIFALDGPAWGHARNIYRDLFSNTRTLANLKRFERYYQVLLRHIPTDGKVVDLQPLFHDFSADMTTSFAIGESGDSMSSTQSEEQRQFADALSYIKRTMARYGFLGPLHVFLSKKKFHESCAIVHRFVEKAIGKALKERHQRQGKGLDESGLREQSLLTSLFDSSNDVLELRDVLVTILIAGTDSIATLLRTTFWLLSRNEEVFDKLQKSVLEAAGHDRPTYDQLRSMKYLRYVLNEVMRFYPPVPFNARAANKDITLPKGGGQDGYGPMIVQKGDMVIFSSWASHRSFKTFGKDAHDFRPERWESMKNETLGYIPYNSGPRACPGQHYALTQTSYIVVRMLQTLSAVKSRDQRGWKEQLGLNGTNANGVLVELVKA